METLNIIDSKLVEINETDICPICFNDVKCSNIKCKECNNTCCIDCINHFKGRSFSVNLPDNKVDYIKYENSYVDIIYPCSFCRFENIIPLETFKKDELVKLVSFDYQRVLKNNDFFNNNIKDKMNYLSVELSKTTNLLKKERSDSDMIIELIKHIEMLRLDNDVFTGKYERIHNETKEKHNYARLYVETKKELLELKLQHSELNKKILQANIDTFKSYLKVTAVKNNHNEMLAVCQDLYSSSKRPTKKEKSYYNTVIKHCNKKLQIPKVDGNLNELEKLQNIEVYHDQYESFEL
tara:strand:- start:8357 stop:9241 length:885 start_codon:yes stop_codon:yes gene_type:complete